MSDFSDQFHLKTDNVDDAVNLLKRANQKGYVMQPINGWTTFFVEDRDFLAQFNEGLLLHFVRTNDALYWTFSLFDKANLVSSYSIEDYFDGFILKNESLNLETFVSTLSLNEEKAKELKTLLAIDNSTDAYGGDYKFAEIVGLENIEWLSYEYIDCDFEEAQEQFEGIFCVDPNEAT